jgi:hypothetical protein
MEGWRPSSFSVCRSELTVSILLVEAVLSREQVCLGSLARWGVTLVR